MLKRHRFGARSATCTASAGAARAARSSNVRWFAGLTWKGLGWLFLLCVLNAVRRTVQDFGPDWAIGPWGSAAAWVLASARVTVWGLLVAVPVAFAVVGGYNVAPARPALRYVVVAWALAASCLLSVTASAYVEDLYRCASASGPCSSREWIDQLPFWWTRYGALCALFTVVFVYLRIAEESTMRSQQAEVERARFVQRMDEARLRMLQAQIEPHFLFNTLASVRRLYQTAPPDAAAMLEHLIRYLAVALPQMRAAGSTLDREAELTRSYLEIQRLRMGHRLQFDIDIPDSLRSAPVPPMMLVTLAENAIKHGLAPLPEGGRVAVRAWLDGGQLRLDVADSGRGFMQSSGGGTGLTNIRARLTAMYGDAGRLSLTRNTPRGVTATIALPFQPDADVPA